MKLLVCSAAAVVALTIGASSSVRASDELKVMQDNPASWVMPNGNYSSTRYSTLSQINKENVRDLQVGLDLLDRRAARSRGRPARHRRRDVLAPPFPNTVFALDLNDDGRVLWKYEPKQDPSVIAAMCCDTVNRGAVYGDGKIGSSRPTRRWWRSTRPAAKWCGRSRTAIPKGEVMTSAPLIYNDKVYVGISGGEWGVHGFLTAYNLSDGKPVWKGFSTGPDDMTLMDPEKTTQLGKPVGKDSGTATWEGDQWKLGGGTTWGWYSVDPDLHLIYYGTGNPGTWNPVQRPGDNRWSMTIFARDLDTGMAKWVYQMTPHDEWDYDGVNEMILADIPVKGKMTKALVHFDRNGFGYTLNRETGELLVAEKFDPAVNWATHVDMETGRPVGVPRYSTQANGEDVNTTNVCPAALGTKDQQPAAYSPKTGLFYVPTNHVCMDYEPYKVSLHRRPALCRRHGGDVSRRRVGPISATSSPGMPARARSSGRCPSRSRSGRALWPPRVTSCSTARSRAT